MSFFKPGSVFFSFNQYPPKEREIIIKIIQELTSSISFNNEESKNFIADDMILFSRSLDFLKEKKFVETVNNALEKNDDHNKAYSSIIWRKHILTWAGEHCKKIEGDFCDFGCYDGVGSKIINDYSDLDGVNKNFYLYDVFDNPPDSHIFPKHSKELYNKVTEKFKKNKNIKIIKGVLPDILKRHCPKTIAFAHIDLNNTKAEMGVLEYIFDKMAKGGIIILDDYGWMAYEDQMTKEKKFFNDKNLKVLELPKGQGMVLIS